MSVLTIRISKQEKAELARRAKSEGVTTGALVRSMIQKKPFTTAGDLLSEMDSLMGDKRLAVRRKR
jgi:hypothetical protein